MRSSKSAKNLIFSVGGNGINIIINFISRTIFISLLGKEYLGINGLFSNILNVLCLAELGVGSAITYCLYEPLATKDISKIQALMNFYKKSYKVICSIIISAGIMLTPFIKFFIKDTPNINYLHLIFLLFVMNTAVSYLFSYKKTIISADQNQYIVSTYQYIAFILQNIIQILVLYITRNFILYLVVQIVVTIVQNILVSKKADKLYPFIAIKNDKKLDKKTLNVIRKNVIAMIFHKIGSIVVNSTDNILISKLIGIGTVGIYSNYSLIINAINSLLNQVFYSITASIGNLGSVESEERVYETFQRVLFLNFWMYYFSSICIITLINPFINLWVGEGFGLDKWVVIIIVLNFYLSGIRKTALTFRDALGLYWYDRYKPIIESIINLVISIILTKKFGVIGIFLGTTISTLTTSIWIEPLVLYKYGFKKNKFELFKLFYKLCKYTIILLVVSILNFNICKLISISPIIDFLIKIIISVLIPNIIFIVLFRENKEFKWIINMINRIISEFTSKGGIKNEKSNSCSSW